MYYGWRIVAASVPVGMYVSGIVSYGFTAFVGPVVQEFGWSYTTVSFAASIRGVETGLLAPVVGILVDRWGGRRLVFCGGLTTAAGLCLLAHTSSVATFYAAFVLMAIGMSCSTSSVLVPAVANWFRDRPGLATGITVSGFGLGGLMLPLMVTLMTHFGWRTAVDMLAIGALALLLPLSAVFRRNDVHPDLYPGTGSSPLATRPDDDRGRLGSKEDSFLEWVVPVVRSRGFWVLLLLFSVHLMAVSTLTAHIMPYLESIGLSRSDAGLIAGTVPLVSIVGRLALGWLGDRRDMKLLSAAMYVMMGIGTLYFGLASSLGLTALVCSLILFSIGYGGLVTLRPLLVTLRFGRQRFGTLFGLLVGIGMAGGMLGPPLAGRVFDVFADYHLAWVALSILSIGCAGLILLLDVPRSAAAHGPT